MAPAILVDYTGQKDLNKYSLKQLVPMMGKSQRSSKGYSSGFVSDYRHVVETMAESEGFGSSGRVDMEMTGSEDSSTRKRKCISLNFGNCNGYDFPAQVHSISKMSTSERKELELRLRAELEQVQTLNKKIALRSTNVVELSACSDIRSGNDGPKRPPPLKFSSGQGKKRVPPSRYGQHMKRGLSGRFESVKKDPPSSNSHKKLMNQCDTLLNCLMTHKFGWVFNDPVDIVKLNIPDYFTVIKHPMDFGTVKRKITLGEYSSPLGFLADVRLTFSNAMTYNPPNNDFHIIAKQLSQFFETRWKAVEKKLTVMDSVSTLVLSRVPREFEADKRSPPVKKKKLSSTNQDVKMDPVKRLMTSEEKHNLSKDLESLSAELPTNIIDFLRGHTSSENQPGEEEMEVDIYVLSDDTLFTLRNLVDDYLQEKRVNQAKAEPCEMEILNESGLSNSSMQPCKGNDPVDEDVDIGGNDPPITSYPPVEIEKDTSHKNSKCSSSSSSSSDSGSSSSDSDSSNSSGSDSDPAKASSPVNATKETSVPGAPLDQQTTNLVNQDGDEPLSVLDQFEQNSQPKQISVEADNRQEGESDPPERPVSPEKLYRAALLRSRFADTILKAREKTLNQGEKGDPEKLRREREELERQQREEKARLQAEAKAAEEARRQAEEEAAAEARRKRERDREAARQALQKMEKTVEINENCQFLEDLEMLSSGPVPHLAIDETGSDQSLDGIGGFNLQGSSNPLERLGLYMKMDDDEEEEGEPDSVPEATNSIPEKKNNDVEEGEID